MPNPFRPTFGTSPPLLVGRDPMVAEFVDALESGPGAPAAASLITGARGSGKTVLLNAFEDAARARGWHVFTETASSGLIDRLVTDRLAPLGRALSGTGADPVELRSITAMGFGASWDRRGPGEDRIGFRPALEQVTDLLEAGSAGIVITVDEVHAADLDELRELTTAVQHAFREERRVVLVAAGLPGAVEAVLNDDVLTFLRRAERFELGQVSANDVARGIVVPLDESGRKISGDALRIAVETTGGYPFMVQLTGHELYRATDDTLIDADAASSASTAAQRRLGKLVHAPALADLSNIDRSFLVAMARDDGPSRMSVIADRLGVTQTYAGQYRLRLIAADMIRPAGHGLVEFELPGLRDYLQDHVAVTLPLPRGDRST